MYFCVNMILVCGRGSIRGQPCLSTGRGCAPNLFLVCTYVCDTYHTYVYAYRMHTVCGSIHTYLLSVNIDFIHIYTHMRHGFHASLFYTGTHTICRTFLLCGFHSAPISLAVPTICMKHLHPQVVSSSCGGRGRSHT